MTFSRRNYSPVLFLRILDKSADDLLSLLTSFEYKRTMDKGAETTFVFRNDVKDLLTSDERFFANTPWQFKFGYFNDMSPAITGIIRKIEPEYQDTRTLTITLLDHTSKMGKSSSGKNWGRVKSSTIANLIADEYNMGGFVEDSDDSPDKDIVQPADMTDLEFLRDMAAQIDFEVFVDGTPPTLVYRSKPYDTPPVKTRLV